MRNTEALASTVLTRKQFLRGAGLLGLAGLFSGATTWASVERALAAGETPTRGGILVFNFTGDPPGFDPLGSTSTQVMSCIAPCYNAIVRADPLDPTKVIGDLAESWDISPDAREYTFRLVKNARFHDGKPLTAADAKFTFDLIRNPPEGVVTARKGALAIVESIDAPDEYTVRFRLKQPSTSFLTNLAGGWMLVLPKHVYENGGDLKNQIVGSGPFKFKEYVRGVSVELERNPDYHVPERPFLDGIKGFIVPDMGTTANYLITGQIQMFVVVRGDAIKQLQKQPGVVLQETPSTSVISLALNSKVAPFDKPEVRKAAVLAIDRAEILKIAQNGYGVLGGVAMPGPWALPADELAKIPGYGTDVEANRAEARKLLADAGLGAGVKIKLLVRRIALFEPVGVVLKDHLERVGFQVELDVQETAAFIDALKKGNFQAAPTAIEYDANDPDAMFPGWQTCSGSQNYAGICDPKLDELIARQSVTTDPAERAKLVHEIETMVLGNHGILYMYWQNRIMGLSDRVHNMQVHPNVDNNLRMQDVWLSA